MAKVLEGTTTMWVVLDASSEVVLMCSGADAPEVVEEWAKKGYRVVQTTDTSVD